MKRLLKLILQKGLGLRNYLFLFSVFKVLTLRFDKGENDFFHFLKLLPEKGVILDIGANIGIMTVLLARGRRQSHIYAAEPIPANLHALRRMLTLFRLRNVTVIPAALGDEQKNIHMVMPLSGKVAMQGLSQVVHDSIVPPASGITFEVAMSRADDIKVWKNANISGIKLDVENFEYFVLLGAKNLLRNNHPIIYCELWDNENRQRCIDLLSGYGYSCFVFDQENICAYEPGRHLTQNFLFLPAGDKPAENAVMI